MKARIFQPTKSAMQSGMAQSRLWKLEYFLNSARNVDSLMGWTSASDTSQQVGIFFENKESAIEFAKNNGLDYVLNEPHKRKIKPKNYASNFAHNRYK